MGKRAETARTRTSSKVSNSRRGFTLIELSAVILLLVILSALILPSVVSQKASWTTRAFVDALPRIAMQTRERAISEGVTTKLTYDGTGKQLVAYEEKTNEADQQFANVSVPDTVQVQNFYLKGQTSSAGDWTLHFYPDGKSDGGAVETNDNGRMRTLVVDKYGIAKLVEGPAPSFDEDRWPAGDYEHRQ